MHELIEIGLVTYDVAVQMAIAGSLLQPASTNTAILQARAVDYAPLTRTIAHAVVM